jgi:iron complex outermembrane receptor protein
MTTSFAKQLTDGGRTVDGLSMANVFTVTGVQPQLVDDRRTFLCCKSLSKNSAFSVSVLVNHYPANVKTLTAHLGQIVPETVSIGTLLRRTSASWLWDCGSSDRLKGLTVVSYKAVVAFALSTCCNMDSLALEGSSPNILITEQSPEFRQFSRVEITGSSIVNPKAKFALPVRVIERKEIERSGARSTPELLQALPMMSNFNELGGFNPSGLGGGYQSAAIRGYEKGTLILINGRRLAPVALQRQDIDRSTSDLMLLPMSAIERIEILTDGASSLYGSDAIAGVINFITKSETLGLQVFSEGQHFDVAGKNGQRLGLAWGKGHLNRDGYNLQAHFSASHAPGLYFKDLPWSTLQSRFERNDANGKPLYFRPVMSDFGDIGKPSRTTESAGDCPPGYEYALRQQSTSYAGAPVYRCLVPALRNMHLYPEQRTNELHVQFERDLQNGHALFSEISHQEIATNYHYGRSTPVTIASTGRPPVLIDLESWNPQNRLHSTTRKRYVVGSKGQWEAWDYKLSYSNSSNRDDFEIRGGFRTNTASGWNSLLSPYAQELLAPLNNASAGLTSTLQSQQLEDRQQRQLNTSTDEVNLTASRKLGETDWGDIQFGTVLFGLQQNFRYASWEGVDFPDYQRTRRNHGIASELQVPARDKLDLTLSARAERYSDFGSILTGKLGGKYAFSEQAFLRASTGTGFRAPTLSQMSPVSTLIGTTRSPTGQTLWKAYATGNPDLQPEKSRQMSFGLHLSPAPHWSTGMDFWQISLRDTFGSWSVTQIDADPMLKNKYYSQQSDGTGRYDITSLNLGTLKKNGIDYYVQHRLPLDFGRLNLALEGTHNLTSRRTAAPGQSELSDLGVFQASYGVLTPRNKLTFSGTLEMPESGFRAAIHFMSGNAEPYPNNSLVDSVGRPVGAQYTHRVKDTLTMDLGGWIQLKRHVRWSWHIKNVANATPPVRYFNSMATTNSSNYPLTDTVYNDYRGRAILTMVEWKIL